MSEEFQMGCLIAAAIVAGLLVISHFLINIVAIDHMRKEDNQVIEFLWPFNMVMIGLFVVVPVVAMLCMTALWIVDRIIQ